MIPEKSGPLATAIAEAGRITGDTCIIEQPDGRYQLPRCERYGYRFDAASPPADCPFRDPVSVYTGPQSILALQDAAFRKMDLARPDADPAGGLLLLKAAETCYACIDVNIRYPIVQRLRAASSVLSWVSTGSSRTCGTQARGTGWGSKALPQARPRIQSTIIHRRRSTVGGHNGR